MTTQRSLFPTETTHLVRPNEGRERIALCGQKCRPGGQREWDREAIGFGCTEAAK